MDSFISTITIFFSVILPLTTAISFSYPNFGPNVGGIEYERDAHPAASVIQLTRNQVDEVMAFSVGRATYREPMRLWDNSSGNLTDFITNFSFVIDSQNASNYADGLTFFLAPNGSKDPNVTQGGAFGLTRDDQYLISTDNPFVAVEFDIFVNGWDPPGEHVGIDINSVQSNKTLTWWSDIKGGILNNASISYNSSTKNLSVVFTGVRNATSVFQHLEYEVDLRDHLPEWVTVGFSAATGSYFAIHSIHSWEFSSTLEIQDNITNPTNPTAALPSPNPDPKRKNMTGLALGLGIGGAVVGGLVLVWVAMVCRKRHGDVEEDDHVFDEDMEDDFERGTGPKKFTYNELARATNDFKDEDKLGEGGFGGVYKGFLRDMNSYIAVKKVSKGSKQGIKEYASEVKIISRLRHRNLVQLIGWCHQRKELLLVYEFMPNGSLDSHLFKDKSLLSWEVRYKIARGLASGLLYLHEEWEQCVVHRDIKSSNVMLDSNFNAKLGDFGLARFVDHEKGSQTTVLAGTMGYMAPECCTTGKASKESDVYSFGVVALELACGRKPIFPNAKEGQIHIVGWVWNLYGSGKLLEAADPRLCGDFVEQQIERLMIVGLWCAHPDENLRPSIRQVIHVFNFDAPLPVLPSKMPIPTYFAPPINVPTSSLTLSSGVTDLEGSQNQSSSYSYNTNSSKFTASSADSSPSASLLYAR